MNGNMGKIQFEEDLTELYMETQHAKDLTELYMAPTDSPLYNLWPNVPIDAYYSHYVMKSTFRMIIVHIINGKQRIG